MLLVVQELVPIALSELNKIGFRNGIPHAN